LGTKKTGPLGAWVLGSAAIIATRKGVTQEGVGQVFEGDQYFKSSLRSHVTGEKKFSLTLKKRRGKKEDWTWMKKRRKSLN